MRHLQHPAEEHVRRKTRGKNNKKQPRNSLQGVPTLRRNSKARNSDRNANQTLQCPMDQEHEESWRMRIYNKPLTARVKLVLLLINSVKLHLTALNTFSYEQSSPVTRTTVFRLKSFALATQGLNG